MNVYKLKTTDWEARVIDKKNFENETAMRFPYYRRSSSEKESLFAVCPACNNPIQIIGLYSQKEELQKRPFGRHVPHDVKGIATYDHEAYTLCPYANPQRYDSTAKKRAGSGITHDILHILQEQYDRVIYLLSRQIGIVISENLAKSMLEKYLGAEGHLYVGSTLLNIPWMLAYRSGSQSLYGRVLHKGSELETALLHHAKNMQINERGQVMPREGKFLNIAFCLVGHQASVEGLVFEESAELLVTQDINGEVKELHRRKLIFEHAYFQNLTHLPEDHPQRKMHLVEMARNLIHL